MFKKIATILFLSFFLGKTYSQITLSKKLTIREALTKIEEQTNYTFSYSETAIDINQKLNNNFNNKSLQNFLQFLYQQKNIKHTINNRQVLLFPTQNKIIKTISGYIKDKTSKEILIFANIYDTISKRGTITNEYGYYSFSTKKDSVCFIVSYVGQKTKLININTQNDSKQTIYLNQKSTLKEIIILDKKQSIINQPGKMEIISSLFNKPPAISGINDPVNTFALMPGVSSNYINNELNVRGGENGENMMLIDGVPLLKMNHFVKHTVINGDAVSKATLYKSNFPVYFSGRTSSFIDVRLKNGNREQIETNGAIGMENTKISIEGPLTKKMSFITSFRRSFGVKNPFSFENNRNFNRNNGSIIRSYDADKGNFYDLYGKLVYYKKKGTISLSVFNESDKDLEYHTHSTFLETIKQTKKQTKSFFVSLQTLQEINSKLIFHNQLSFYSYNLNYFNGVNNLQGIPQNSYAIKKELGEKKLIDETDLNIQNYIFNNKIEYNLPSHKIVTGINTTLRNYMSKTKDSSIRITETTTINNNIEGNLFINDRISLSKKLQLNIGLSNTFFTNKTYSSFKPEPRISLHYNNKNNISLTYSKTNQYLQYSPNYFARLVRETGNIDPVDFWVLPSKETPPITSNQISLSYNYKKIKNLTITTSSYYKKSNNILSKRSIYFPNYIGSSLLNKTQNYGTEILIEKQGTKLTGWIAYDLSWSKINYDTLLIKLLSRKQEIYYTEHDSRHKLNVVLNYQITKKNDISASWKFKSGTPFYFKADTINYSHLDTLTYNLNGNETKVNEKDILAGKEYRFPNYHELDIQFRFKFGKKWKSTLTFGMKNTYLNSLFISYPILGSKKGALFLYFDETWDEISTFYGFIPYITYQFKF